MDIHGYLWISTQTQAERAGIFAVVMNVLNVCAYSCPFVCIDIHGYARWTLVSIDIHGEHPLFPWIRTLSARGYFADICTSAMHTFNIQEYSWISTSIHGYARWMLMDICGHSPAPTDIHLGQAQYLWILLDIHEYLRISTNIYAGCLCIFADICGHSRVDEYIVMDIYEYT